MRKIENEARLRREQDILDRIENVKRLIQMETTMLTCDGCGMYPQYRLSDRDGKVFSKNLLSDVRDEIQMQLLSIVALCYGAGPDVGEPVPMLEWKQSTTDQHSSDKFWDMWDECLGWNA